MTVLIHVDTSKQVGDPDHLKVFTNADAPEAWFAENDPEGVAFEYEVIGPPARTGAPLPARLAAPGLRSDRDGRLS